MAYLRIIAVEMIPELLWPLNMPDSFGFGVPTWRTYTLPTDPPKDQVCQRIEFGLSTPELFGSRWDIVLQCADLLGQYDCQDLVKFVRDAPNIPEPFMRIRIVSILLALMRKGIAPRWSGLLDWRGNAGLLDRRSVFNVDSDVKLIDLLWLLGEEEIETCLKFLTCQQKTGVLLHRIGADRFKSLGCVKLYDGKLHASLKSAKDSFEKGKDANKFLSLYTHNKMSRDKKKALADEKALRVFAGRLGALAGQRARWAKGAEAYKMMTGLEIDRSDLGKECRAAEKFLSDFAPLARNQKVRNHAETDSAQAVQCGGSNAESEVL